MRWRVLLAVLISATPIAAAEWFVSNAVGIAGEPISAGEASGHDYVLQVERRDGVEVRTLLRNGGEVQRVEVTRQGSTSVERTYRDGDLESEIVVRDDGRPLTERIHADGALTEEREYQYESDQLVSRLVRDEADQLLYRETYFYWRDGTLRSIVKDEASAVRTEYRYTDGRLREEWISRPGGSERFRFDAAGRLVTRERFVNGELVEQEVRQYWGATSEAVIRDVVIVAGGETLRRGYDERGRLVSERDEIDGAVVRELTRLFDGDLLAAEIEEERNATRRWDYRYADDGEQTGVTYRENGQLVEVSYLVLGPEDAPADRMTELYRRGEPILRVYYAGRERIREEVIRDGEVIQRREFPGPAGGRDQ